MAYINSTLVVYNPDIHPHPHPIHKAGIEERINEH